MVIKQSLDQKLSELFSSFGYKHITLPVLGPTELFLRKSGGEMAAQIYDFADVSGNQICLRPEFTAPIMRHYLDHATEESLPVRWHYGGPVFRHNLRNSTAGENRGQFTQIGAELIGPDTVLADAELLILATRILQELDIRNCTIRIGDLAILNSVLDVANLSERARDFLVSQIPLLAGGNWEPDRLEDRARQLNLIEIDSNGSGLSLAIADLDDEQARQVLSGFLGWTSGESVTSPSPYELDDPTLSEKRDIATEHWGNLGRRDPSNIVDRLLRKIRGGDQLTHFRQGIELISELISIRGSAKDTITRTEDFMRRVGADLSPVQRLTELVELLTSNTNRIIAEDDLELDFGLARGLAYYNGIIFDVNHPSLSEPLGGGGRYDDLAKALGSEYNLPALGFAYQLESLVQLSPCDTVISEVDWGDRVLVATGNKKYFEDVIRKVNELYQTGVAAEAFLEVKSIDEVINYAKYRNSKEVVWIASEHESTIYQTGYA